MKKLMLIFFFIFNYSTSFASSDVIEVYDLDDLQIIQNETLLNSRISIKDVKQFLKTNSTDNSCMSDYWKDRRRVVIKLALSPLTLAVMVAGSAYGGGFLGGTLGKLDNRYDGWAQLGWVITGIMGGGLVGAGSWIGDTVSDGMRLRSNNIILKALAEEKLGNSTFYREKLYRLLFKSTADINSEEFIEFNQNFLKLNETGALCDGSLRNRRIFSNRLKNRLARLKDLKRYFKE
jgi:hypothetical protein